MRILRTLAWFALGLVACNAISGCSSTLAPAAQRSSFPAGWARQEGNVTRFAHPTLPPSAERWPVQHVLPLNPIAKR